MGRKLETLGKRTGERQAKGTPAWPRGQEDTDPGPDEQETGDTRWTRFFFQSGWAGQHEDKHFGPGWL